MSWQKGVMIKIKSKLSIMAYLFGHGKRNSGFQKRRTLRLYMQADIRHIRELMWRSKRLHTSKRKSMRTTVDYREKGSGICGQKI